MMTTCSPDIGEFEAWLMTAQHKIMFDSEIDFIWCYCDGNSDAYCLLVAHTLKLMDRNNCNVSLFYAGFIRPHISSGETSQYISNILQNMIEMDGGQLFKQSSLMAILYGSLKAYHLCSVKRVVDTIIGHDGVHIVCSAWGLYQSSFIQEAIVDILHKVLRFSVMANADGIYMRVLDFISYVVEHLETAVSPSYRRSQSSNISKFVMLICMDAGYGRIMVSQGRYLIMFIGFIKLLWSVQRSHHISVCICWALAKLINVSYTYDNIDVVMEHNMHKLLIYGLSLSREHQEACLMGISFIVPSSHYHVQRLLNSGLLQQIHILLESYESEDQWLVFETTLQSDICIVLYNIIRDCDDHVRELMNAGILAQMLRRMRHANDPMRHDACEIIMAAVDIGDAEFIGSLVSGLPAYSSMSLYVKGLSFVDLDVLNTNLLLVVNGVYNMLLKAGCYRACVEECCIECGIIDLFVQLTVMHNLASDVVTAVRKLEQVVCNKENLNPSKHPYLVAEANLRG